MRRANFARVCVVVGYIVAACVFTWPLPVQLGTHLTGDPTGDTGVYVWNQWVFHQELVAGHNPLATEKILALTSPAISLTQHNYTPFQNLLALPLISSLGVIAAFNIVFIIVCVLNGVMAYALARRATAATRWEAWLAGLVFAWSPAMVARTTGHYSLAAAAALPAFLWALLRAERSHSVRDAALVGLCMAWAALSDAYFGIYCLMIGVLYAGVSLVRVDRAAHTPRPWRWLLDVLIGCVGGLIAGLLIGGGGDISLLGLQVKIRSLYTPVLILTLLILVRAAIAWRPHLEVPALQRMPVKAILVGVIACATPMSPVLYGLGQTVVEGRFVNPQIFWRSSPTGVDLLSFITPNQLHPVARFIGIDPLANRPTHFVEYTAAVSLVALAVIAFAIWKAGFRPHKGWVAITIGFALLALGPFIYVGGMNTHVPGPWALLRYLPGVGLARMPTRFALVALLGVAILMAAALAQIGERWPHRRRQVGAFVGLLLVFELLPGPRPLYSAAISPIYDRIAADPRPVRVLVLPFGVRDGTWETGNFRPGTQFTQIRHGKALLGGYLSRISPHRAERMRKDYPTLDALITLSEPPPPGPEVKATLDARADRLVAKANIGYVVIDTRFIPPERERWVVDAFGLIELQRDGHLRLYAPDSNLP